MTFEHLEEPVGQFARGGMIRAETDGCAAQGGQSVWMVYKGEKPGHVVISWGGIEIHTRIDEVKRLILMLGDVIA